MSDEMKLLMALCDALGFDVEVKYDYKERRISKSHAMQINQGFQNHELTLQTKGMGMLDVDDDEMYLARLTTPVVSYRLAKKEAMVPMPVNSDAWSSIVQYVNNHTGDIEAGINDFDTLRPALDFFNRNSK